MSSTETGDDPLASACAVAAGDLSVLSAFLRRVGSAAGEELEVLARQAPALADALDYLRRPKPAHRPRRVLTPADRAKAIRVAAACKAAIARGDGPKREMTRRYSKRFEVPRQRLEAAMKGTLPEVRTPTVALMFGSKADV